MKRTISGMEYRVVYRIDPKWRSYDNAVANAQLNSFERIFVDVYGTPIDNEYDLEEIAEKEGL